MATALENSAASKKFIGAGGGICDRICLCNGINPIFRSVQAYLYIARQADRVLVQILLDRGIFYGKCENDSRISYIEHLNKIFKNF